MLNLSGSPTSPTPRGSDSPLSPSKMNMMSSAGNIKAKKVDLDLLERKAEEHANGLNGHA